MSDLYFYIYGMQKYGKKVILSILFPISDPYIPMGEGSIVTKDSMHI